ncbi:methyl-accepting chemotaxis protein [Pelovirga terrestris]
MVAILAVIISFILVRAISPPVRRGVAMAQEIAKGDFSMRLNMNRGDEIGTLAQALDDMAENLSRNADVAEQIADGNLNVEVQLASEKDQLGLALQTMVLNLNDILSQIQVAAEQIASGSGEVADSSQSLSQGATESASSLEEISASLNQLSSQTGTNAENANTANQLAGEARNAAEQGSRKMQDMVAAMSEINDAGQSISKIIKVIDEIAFQTNLLALNAAVEAARAGQHGKGFAVVAEEVRNLAARSAKAAAETSELIEGSVQKTANGTTIADQTAQSLQSIVNVIGKVTDLVAEIAAASSEQAQGVSQINQGVNQIDQVTQQNTASAEESAAASEELSGQAAQLREMLLRFKLKGSGNTHANVRAIPHIPQQQEVKAQTAGWGESPAPAPKKIAGKKKKKKAIALDDDEFGKY